MEQRGWFNELGCYVQRTGDSEPGEGLQLSDGNIRVQAGSQGTVFGEILSIDGGLSWLKVKWSPGEWESLIEPTSYLARWLVRQDGLSEENQDIYWGAVRQFRDTGEITLPDNEPWLKFTPPSS